MTAFEHSMKASERLNVHRQDTKEFKGDLHNAMAADDALVRAIRVDLGIEQVDAKPGMNKHASRTRSVTNGSSPQGSALSLPITRFGPRLHHCCDQRADRSILCVLGAVCLRHRHHAGCARRGPGRM